MPDKELNKENDGLITEKFKSVRNSSVKIFCRDYKNKTQIGSGVAIGDTYILTCAHVVGIISKDDKPPMSLAISDDSDKQIEAHLIGYDIHNDIALITVGFANINQIELSERDEPTEGESIICVGAPLGYDNSVSSGIVSNSLPDQNNFLMDIRVNPGNSGGMVYSTEENKVVGIASAMLFAPGNSSSSGLGVAIGMNAIRPFLQSNGVNI